MVSAPLRLRTDVMAHCMLTSRGRLSPMEAQQHHCPRVVVSYLPRVPRRTSRCQSELFQCAPGLVPTAPRGQNLCKAEVYCGAMSEIVPFQQVEMTSHAEHQVALRSAVIHPALSLNSPSVEDA